MGHTETPLLNCRLLIVEDDFRVAQTIIDAVEAAGSEVVGPFTRMIDALEQLIEFDSIDGAILDIGLDGEESYVLAEALQTTRIPFMFLTGRDRSALPEQFARTPLMSKPFTPDGLVDMLVSMGVVQD